MNFDVQPTSRDDDDDDVDDEDDEFSDYGRVRVKSIKSREKKNIPTSMSICSCKEEKTVEMSDFSYESKHAIVDWIKKEKKTLKS